MTGGRSKGKKDWGYELLFKYMIYNSKVIIGGHLKRTVGFNLLSDDFYDFGLLRRGIHISIWLWNYASVMGLLRLSFSLYLRKLEANNCFNLVILLYGVKPSQSLRRRDCSIQGTEVAISENKNMEGVYFCLGRKAVQMAVSVSMKPPPIKSTQ